MSTEFLLMLGMVVTAAIIGVPIGIALIAGSVAYLWMRGLPLTMVTDAIMQGFSSNFVFLAIPLFIFAARVMNAGTITDRMLNFAMGAVGHARGGRRRGAGVALEPDHPVVPRDRAGSGGGAVEKDRDRHRQAREPEQVRRQTTACCRCSGDASNESLS